MNHNLVQVYLLNSEANGYLSDITKTLIVRLPRFLPSISDIKTHLWLTWRSNDTRVDLIEFSAGFSVYKYS